MKIPTLLKRTRVIFPQPIYIRYIYIYIYAFAYIKNNNDHRISDIGIVVCTLATSSSLIKHKENLPKIATHARTNEHVFVFVEFVAAPPWNPHDLTPVRKKIAPRVELTCSVFIHLLRKFFFLFVLEKLFYSVWTVCIPAA